MMKLWRQHREGIGRTGLAPGVLLSVMAHGVIVIAAIDATSEPPTAERELPANSIARFLAPPDRDPGSRPRAEVVHYVLAMPEVRDASGPLVAPADERRPADMRTGFDDDGVPPAIERRDVDSVFSAVQVDSAATRYEWSAAPAYPPGMLAKNTEGVVRAEFVVTQEGYVDTTTLRVIDSTDPEFTKAVKDALPFMRYVPARIGHTPVSQLVAQEFRFEITSVADTQRANRKPAP